MQVMESYLLSSMESSLKVLATVQIRDERSAGMLESCLLESEKNPQERMEKVFLMLCL